jgi:hypothetical protein
VKNGQGLFTACIKAGKQPIRPDLPDDEAGLRLAKEEVRRLHTADLFWVDEHMTDLTIAAAATMPPFNILPEDLPSQSGLIFFEKPLQKKPSHDEFADHIYVRAASWGPAPADTRWDIWVSWYTDCAMNIESIDPARLTKIFGVPASKALRTLTRHDLRMPPLSYEIEELISFSETPLPYASAFTGEVMEGSDYPLKELVTAWTLMQQPIAKTRDAEFDRASRRRLQKAGIEPKPVRVISLRRPTSAAGERGESGREYHHKWIVRGHWRQQWYPGRQVHRPVWIAPHIKGPEDAPLLGGDKVYAWTK